MKATKAAGAAETPSTSTGCRTRKPGELIDFQPSDMAGVNHGRALGSGDGAF